MALHSAFQSVVILTIYPTSTLWTCLPGESFKQLHMQDLAMLSLVTTGRQSKYGRVSLKAYLSIP